MAWKSSLVLGVIVLALISAVPVLAVDPTYLADMPTPEKVIEKTPGSDAFDTSARQHVAFDRLYSLTVALIGDRYVAGQMTPAEKSLRDTYLGNRDRILRELKASLPADQRESPRTSCDSRTRC